MPRKKSTVEGGKGHVKGVRKDRASSALSPSSESSAEGQKWLADKAEAEVPPADDTHSLAAGHKRFADNANEGVPAASEAIEQLRYWHRQRCFAMEQRKRMDLSLGAFLRVMLGWSLAKPEDERKQIAKQAAELLDDPEGSEWTEVIAASVAARAPFATIEKKALKEMVKLAEMLPVWETFAKDVRGFGLASLAVIVAESGDLSNYSNHSKLWKRMGLAVLDGKRQGGLAKGASKEAWIEHGYNPVRRSRMWNIGDTLIKGNRTGVYRAAYLDRKRYEIVREPDIKPIKAHRRAQRYMEKRLLKHLWQAWRRARGEMANWPVEAMPASSIRNAA